MKLFGKSATEYVRFSKAFVIVVLLIGLTRLGISLGGAPNDAAKWFSMTAIAWIGVLYFAVRVHTSGFGAYRQLLPIVALLNLTAQAVAVAAIAIAIFTGVDNVFSAPEYAFGSDGKTWLHLGAHLFIGTTIGTLLPWLIGCAVMFVSMKRNNHRRTSATSHA